jgi:hypothetical protein
VTADEERNHDRAQDRARYDVQFQEPHPAPHREPSGEEEREQPQEVRVERQRGEEEWGRGRGDQRSRLIVVDAANVVGSRPDGWWRDRPGAALRLLEKVATLGQKVPEPVEVVVVLEGAAKRAMDDAPDLGELRVVLAANSGDDTIVDVVEAAADEDADRVITVVTADRGLRERVGSHGADSVGPRWLWDYLDE